jgi:hypothetical protein
VGIQCIVRVLEVAVLVYLVLLVGAALGLVGVVAAERMFPSWRNRHPGSGRPTERAAGSGDDTPPRGYPAVSG